jgi:methylase of polypeptide subunit release factors
VAPLILADSAQFETVRTLLRGSGYTTEGICSHLNIEFLDEYPTKAKETEQPRPISSALDVLLSLFFEGGLVTRKRMAAYLGNSAYDDLSALGLIAPLESETCYATVLLYPVNDVYICSDRWSNPDGSKFKPFDDIVYSARSITTQRFLRLIPTSPCEALLDLCSGTGVFGLVSAPWARRVYAFDIADRSTHFAEFNRRLNGVENLVCATGDLYEPAGKLTFDRIIAHPPYVPVLKNQLIFQDGGDDGESILRRVVEDLPRYLQPGGRLYCSSMGSDRFQEPFEQRIAEWLGGARGEFDVAVIVRSVRDPQDYAVRDLLRGTGDVAELKQWEALFRGKRIERLVYANIVIQRHAEARPAFTIRRQMGRGFASQELQWMLDWETAATRPDVFHKILSSRLRAPSHTELHTKHELAGGDWKPAAYSLESPYPFESKADVEAWSAFLVGHAQGQTGLELLEELKREEILHPETPPEEFADALTTLISGGFLESAAFPLPRKLVKAA